MDITKYKTLFAVLIAALWIACIVLGTTGHFVIAMCLGVPLMMLHILLGVARNGKIPMRFFIYPILIWAVLWVVSFILSGYYADMFAGQEPAFTVLGLHPSFAPTVFLYWIGGQLTLNLGLYLRQDDWLSEKDWEEFCEKVHNMKEEEA
ncbi:MAG: hypothetical protein IJP92_17600 [Lachnospiraceae bacterium]|nr:hypothetical protein [Lachnospiraceae bacterium]